jgi:hypothetical protein
MTLHAVSYGAGVPVVALHGWTADHRLMLGCLEPVFTGRPGLSADLRRPARDGLARQALILLV